MKAYKYRDPSNRTLEIFSTRKIYFPHAAQLNDPLDSQIDIDAEYQKVVDMYPPNKSEEYLRKSFLIHILNQHSFMDKHGKEIGLNGALQRFISVLGIYSLSKTPTDALLWSHYGGSHTGIAIEFDTDLIQEKSIFIRKDMRYAKHPPYQDLFLDLANRLGEFVKPWESNNQYDAAVGDRFYTQQLSELMHANLFVKSKKWKYEEEYRLVSNRTGAHEFPAESLRSVTFGVKTNLEFIKKIEKILNTPDYAHVNVYFVQHKTGSFDFELTKTCNTLMKLDKIT
ncbi:DUF2971 domain-containing protein [Pseudomonas danubii]|uniref:DUF2971 domain-containing protein n=1 Tax=Pseudomonas danubii TaxID=2497146 RepID=UPI003857D6B6